MQAHADGHRPERGRGTAAGGEKPRLRRPASAGKTTAGRSTRSAADARATTARLADTMADAGMVRARLLRAIDRQVRIVDARLTGAEAEIDERDSRILGHLAKTLGMLMEIGEGGRTSKDREPPDRDDPEDRLAERIKKWARGGE